jgi:hypothetical protein
LLSRQLGLECEFFVRHPPEQARDSLTDYIGLVTSLHRQLPCAPSVSNPLRHFLANGSSISLETGAVADFSSALFETATPECRSPRDLVAYELANEQLLEQAFAEGRTKSNWSLIKSNTDAHGHTLGQHESYDMRIAQGKWLIAWWCGLISMLPMVLVYRLLAGLWMLLLHGLWMVDKYVYLTALRMFLPKHTKETGDAQARTIDRSSHSGPTSGGVEPIDDGKNHRGIEAISDSGQPRKPHHRIDSHGSEELDEEEWVRSQFMPTRWLRVAAFGLRWLHRPIAYLFECLIRLVALRAQRRELASFLATRSILDGSGYIDEQGRYWVSQRAASVNCVIGFGSYGSNRPMFRCDTLLRELFAGPFWSLRRYLRLFRRKQRIELAIGDSGMCQQSQYLRFGVTSLLLDWVEIGHGTGAPRLQSEIEAMNEFARDWMLVRTVQDSKNRDRSALELQRLYLKIVKQWLGNKEDVPAEAWDIVGMWQTTLNQMVLKPQSQSELPMTLVGRIDWLTKLWLLNQMESGTSWQVRKKIDIRYHELSEDGYHRQLTSYLNLAPVIRDSEIERARRTPPNDSPARRRGSLIRELSGENSDLRVDWRNATYELDGTHYAVQF